MKSKIVLYAAVAVLIAAVVNLFSGGGRTYQLDLFSVISFGLAIAAFMLSIFAAWLSWEFYKKSTEALDLVRTSVSNIETSVSGVQSNITEIVKTAVKHWTQNDSVESQQQFEDYRELREEIDALKTSNPDLEDKLNAFMAGINERLASAKAQAIFPSGDFNVPTYGPSILLSQEIDQDDDVALQGRIIFEVRRPTRNASCRLKVRNCSKFTQLKLQILESPNGTSDKFKVTQGVDQHGNLNVHLSGQILEGKYVVEFKAP